MSWTTDAELFELARRELCSAIVGDALEKAGYRRQFLPPRIRPIDPAMTVIGRAMTVLQVDVFDPSTGGTGDSRLKRPPGLLFDAVDDLQPGEVYVCTGASPTYALWGELVTIRAKHLGAAGAVLDGYVRDTAQLLALEFPTFGAGSYARSPVGRGKVIDFRCPIEIGEARVDCGDLLFGDVEGVCVVPRAAEREVIGNALEIVRTEHHLRDAVMSGMSVAAAYAKFGAM